MEQTTQTKPKIKFKTPRVSRERYFSMYGHEFYDLEDEVSRANTKWVRENLQGSSEWAIVIGQKVVETGNKRVYPSVYEIRRHSDSKELAYLVKRIPE
jgi:hypothetical protein